MTRRSLGILLGIDTIPILDKDTSILSSTEALMEIHLSADEPQTLRDEYS
jgi:hypothetical protein